MRLGWGLSRDGMGIGPEEVVVVTTMRAEFFLSMLEQDRVWVTQDGRRMLVEEMERSHRRNVLAMLERKRDELYRDWLGEFLDDGATYEELSRLGWVSPDVVTGRYRPAGATAWFERQPLVMTLRALQNSRV
jgi:hypothetical protein